MAGCRWRVGVEVGKLRGVKTWTGVEISVCKHSASDMVLCRVHRPVRME